MPNLTEEEAKIYLMNAGKCEGFDVQDVVKVCNMLVAYDEPVRALQILDGMGLPGYYRDNPPPEILHLKRQIYAKLATPNFYMHNIWDKQVDVERSLNALHGTLRGLLISKDIEALNQAGFTPHIVDMGPGEYWLPIGLHKTGHKFTYEDIGLTVDAPEKAREILPAEVFTKGDGPAVFVACEIIEHLYNEGDLRVEMQRHARNAEIIHVSTPKYTFDGRLSQLEWWKKGDLGHLRTYTPSEFWTVVTRMFWDYEWVCAEPNNTQILHMRGTRKNGS